MAHKKSKTIRSDFLSLYGHKDAPVDLADQQFRFFVSRPGARRLNFTDRLTEVEWRDEGTVSNLNTIPVLRGTLTWHDDDPNDPSFRAAFGDVVRCDVKWLGKWQPLWEMRMLTPPERTIEDGTATVEVADDLALISKSQGDFRYRKGKHKNVRGWRYEQIVRDVCSRYKIPVGQLVRGTKWIDNFDQNKISPLEAIRQAVLAEQDYTGKRYIICWRPKRDRSAPGGWRFCLHVLNASRNPYLLLLHDEIRNATSSPVMKSQLATSLVVTGSSKGKKGKRTKMTIRENAKSAIKRYGFIERHLEIGGNPTREKLVRRAKLELAKNLKATRAMSNFVHTGIAYTRRGDVLRLALPAEGYKGDAAFMFVVGVTHTLDPADYSMTMELTWRDPLDPNAARKSVEAALRARKRRKHGKKKK